MLALVAGLPLAVLQVSSAREYHRLALAEGALSAQALAESTGAATVQFLAVAEGVLTGATSQTAPSLLDPARCESVVRVLNRSLPFVVNLLVADDSGAIQCSAVPRPEGSITSVAGRSWFQEALSTGKFSVGPPLIGGITGQWIVALAVPILGPDGAVRGVLGASVPLDRLQSFLTGARPAPDELITIADHNRVVLARSQDPEQWVGRQLPPKVQLEDSVGPNRVITSGVDFLGIDRTWAEVDLPSVGWTVYAGIPAHRIEGPARAVAQRQAGLIVVIILLAALLAGLVQKLISGSLRSLVVNTGDTGAGAVITVPEWAPREIRALATQFTRTLQDRSRAEQSERLAKERYRSILDNAVFGIYLSTPDGRFLEVNPALAHLLGYDGPEELLQVGPAALYRNPQVRESFVSRYVREAIIDDVEVEWVRKDGTPITVRLNGKKVTLGDDEVAFEVMAEDITGQKALEEELRHTQKMEAVGRLAGGVAHDFNNLLTVITGNSDVLLDVVPAADPRRVEIQEIRDAANRAEALTRQLLAFSRKERAQARLVDLNETVATLEKMLGRIMREDIRLRSVLDPAIRPLLADPSQLEQVIMNLAVNARDAMPNGGDVTLETRWAAHGPLPERSPVHGGGWVCLSVQDSGVGMDAATRGRIFEPFFTTKAKGRGTGLGLATVYAIVDAAGGHVLVDSEPNQGSRFDVWLPAAKPGVAAGAARVEEAEAPTGAGGTVLVAEDEAPVRRIVCRVLEGAGYRVLLAADGDEAIRLSDETPGPIDLVITDVVMPAVKGTTVADHIAATRPDTPVLFISGYTDDLPIGKRIGRRAELFLPKPFTPSQLRTRVREILRGTPTGRSRQARA
jgi:PAS domain S-box-containing protein